MRPADRQHARLAGADLLGGEQRTLSIGDLAIRLEGLTLELCSILGQRWGGFLGGVAAGERAATVRLLACGTDTWLDAPQPREVYRIEPLGRGAERLVASYHFAVCESGTPGTWLVGLTEGADEPAGRMLDNALRWITGRLAVRSGGFALHAAAVLHEGRAWVFAGGSGAGKSTVVGLLAPAASLGDDFAVVLPTDDGWAAPAVPFDNSERAESEPPRGLFPVAGIWRLFQAETTRVERPADGLAVASLMGCVAFPWTMPECSGDLLAHAERFVADGGFRHLQFTREPELWTALV